MEAEGGLGNNQGGGQGERPEEGAGERASRTQGRVVGESPVATMLFRLSDYCFGVKDQGGWGKVQRSPGKRFELWSQKSEERGSLEAARVWLINSIMQRIIGTLKFQGLVLGAKFVLTAPCPVEESGVKGRLLLAKQRKLRSEQKK